MRFDLMSLLAYLQHKNVSAGLPATHGVGYLGGSSSWYQTYPLWQLPLFNGACENLWIKLWCPWLQESPDQPCLSQHWWLTTLTILLPLKPQPLTEALLWLSDHANLRLLLSTPLPLLSLRHYSDSVTQWPTRLLPTHIRDLTELEHWLSDSANPGSCLQVLLIVTCVSFHWATNIGSCSSVLKPRSLTTAFLSY